MKKVVKEYNVYSFNELKENIQEKVLDKYRMVVEDTTWYDFIREDFEELLKEKGFNVSYNDIYFSVYEYLYFDRGYIDVKKYLTYINETEKYSKLIKFYEYNELELAYTIIGKSYYERSYVHFSGDHIDNLYDDVREKLTDNEYKELTDLIEVLEKDLNDYKYTLEKDCLKDLQKHYEYLTSDECIKEFIDSNGLEFLEDGTTFLN
jgi:hypothetical protein